ncbi:hypothetical protein FVEN_g12855 [Fusarium venenatum]|uniref:Uncharacterized protein n=2 Tax=Fusarium venenatum TaxID=56646 RepID=A0A2L2TXG0_9HYPO|nr:uncharacterized protein FVRRES_01917 [Fusarium venenatum]KAG8355829.1 hypothetical protein FVEN_g12855 [Fusarium venenatum]CEI65405.1 unnamed protein product [Fusarium venenatum]
MISETVCRAVRLSEAHARHAPHSSPPSTAPIVAPSSTSRQEGNSKPSQLGCDSLVRVKGIVESMQKDLGVSAELASLNGEIPQGQSAEDLATRLQAMMNSQESEVDVHQR